MVITLWRMLGIFVRVTMTHRNLCDFGIHNFTEPGRSSLDLHRDKKKTRCGDMFNWKRCKHCDAIELFVPTLDWRSKNRKWR